MRTHKDFKIAVDEWKVKAENLATKLSDKTIPTDLIRAGMKDHNNTRHFMLIEGLQAIKQGKHSPTWAKSLLTLLEYPESVRLKRTECLGTKTNTDGKCCNPLCRKCRG